MIPDDVFLDVAFYRRRGSDAAIEAIGTGPPSLLMRPSVAPVTLFEVWLHHDDLRRANHLTPPDELPSLHDALEFARSYQGSRVDPAQVDPSASTGDMPRRLAGRPTVAPPHVPPLRF